ncbi:MAG TPA: helix-turn-helix domain-containing protein [Acidimicrobiales bacterium]|nr:helix-turn-helix domain-containing protein [Acidimicrobiales bacterium]
MADSLAAEALGVPEVPGPDLDLYLDAAARCFARHGLGRTKVVDIADELRVSRVTVYRQVGNVDRAARLLLARELDRLLSTLLPRLSSATRPDDIIDIIADALRFAIDHPVLSKVLRDEPELVGVFVVTELDSLLERLRRLAEPLLVKLEAIGVKSPVDVAYLADWVTRVLVTMVLAPPADDIDGHLRAVMGPLLARPGRAARQR